jgi:hypothetical protein
MNRTNSLGSRSCWGRATNTTDPSHKQSEGRFAAKQNFRGKKKEKNEGEEKK